MTLYYKPIILTILLSLSLQAQEVFLDTKGLNLAHISHSSKYCKSTSNSTQLCQKKELSYLDYEDAQLPHFLSNLKQLIAPIVADYMKEDLKKQTLRDIKDFNADISGEWHNQSAIDLFSKTPNTFTLSHSSSGYGGGAHGYYSLHLENYLIGSTKQLTLGDLFYADYNTTLHRIAEKHYKQVRGLNPHQPLTDDNWFENTFLLARNFAITPRGLYFFYNQYEVQPYAAGNAEFLLPYSKIRTLIKPNGPLHFALQNKQSTHATFNNDNQMSIEVDTQIQKNGMLTITAKMKNLSFLNNGWFSLSFPQFTHNSPKNSISYSGFSKVFAYPKGSKVYHNTLKKAVSSSYLLIEGEDRKWNYNDTHTLSITLATPPQMNELILDIRGNLKSKEKTYMLPSPYDGVKGQQGFTNHRLFIDLKQKAY